MASQVSDIENPDLSLEQLGSVIQTLGSILPPDPLEVLEQTLENNATPENCKFLRDVPPSLEGKMLNIAWAVMHKALGALSFVKHAVKFYVEQAHPDILHRYDLVDKVFESPDMAILLNLNIKSELFVIPIIRGLSCGELFLAWLQYCVPSEEYNTLSEEVDSTPHDTYMEERGEWNDTPEADALAQSKVEDILELYELVDEDELGGMLSYHMCFYHLVPIAGQ